MKAQEEQRDAECIDMTAAGDFDQRQGIPGVEQYAAWILVAPGEAAYEEKTEAPISEDQHQFECARRCAYRAGQAEEELCQRRVDRWNFAVIYILVQRISQVV